MDLLVRVWRHIDLWLNLLLWGSLIELSWLLHGHRIEHLLLGHLLLLGNSKLLLRLLILLHRRVHIGIRKLLTVLRNLVWFLSLVGSTSLVEALFLLWWTTDFSIFQIILALVFLDPFLFVLVFGRSFLFVIREIILLSSLLIVNITSITPFFGHYLRKLSINGLETLLNDAHLFLFLHEIFPKINLQGIELWLDFLNKALVDYHGVQRHRNWANNIRNEAYYMFGLVFWETN